MLVMAEKEIFIKLCFIVSFFQYGVTIDILPVFVIDHDQVLPHMFTEPNPLIKTASLMFSDMVQDALKVSSALVIFVEEQFSTEDVSSKDEKGTPFALMQKSLKDYKVKYLPNVANPINTITGILEPTQRNVYVLKPGQLLDASVEELKYFYVFFKDNKRDETRVEALRRHNTAIFEIYRSLQKVNGRGVVGIYTGKYNPQPLTDDRALKGIDAPELDMHSPSEGALFRFRGMRLVTTARSRSDFSHIPIAMSVLRSGHKVTYENLETDVEFQGIRMRFSFRFMSDFWYLDDVTILDAEEPVGRTFFNIRVPIGKSYFCDEPLIIINRRDGSLVSIEEYQIQPHIPVNSPIMRSYGNKLDYSTLCRGILRSSQNPNGTETEIIEFCDAIKCGPYFNIHILTGLSVTAVCFTIAMVAVVFLYGLETNERYDDPLGKPLIILSDG